ncbi:MAG: type III polyketide synthase [Phycisphaerales bacterium]
MPAHLRSIATALPEERMPRAAWAAIADRITPPEVDRAVLARLADRSGIDERGCAAAGAGAAFYPDPGAAPPPGTAERMALWSRTARTLAARAASDALARARVDASRITHVITASCTGFESPGIDAHLIETLGLPRTCRRLNVGFMGCHAAVNALAAARDAVLADPGAAALVCCAEVSSAHFHRSSRLDQLVANTLFADGAAAAVVSADPAPADAPPAGTVLATHGVLIPDSADEMRWDVGNHGFEMTLGACVPDILRAHVGQWVRDVLGAHGIDLADVGGWAIHPGGPRVIDAVADTLQLPMAATDASRAVLRSCGNMSSATLLAILERLAAAQTPRPWVGLAFGPGLAGELVIVR